MLSRQRGLSLLESLVAMALLATAFLGLLGGQLQGFSEQRASSHRADALRLIDDLAERMRSHAAPSSGSPGAPGAAAWLIDWDEMPAAGDCERSPCDAATLARADLAAWKRAVAQALPSGRAKVAGDRSAAQAGLLTVILAWRPAGADSGRWPSEADDEDGAACPGAHICHLGHVPL